MRDTADLVLIVTHVVARIQFAISFLGLLLAEVHAADELAHDHEVDAVFHQFRLQRRSVLQLREDLGRAQVCV